MRARSLTVLAAILLASSQTQASGPYPVNGKPSTETVLQQIAPAARARFLFDFWRAGVHYPPQALVFIALKKERRLEVWSDKNGRQTFIKSYPILGASGVSGPKLYEGDMQVPEGVYHLTGLDPASRFHLAMGLNYPNEYDWERAKAEQRYYPGTDIQIHGKAESSGCVAVGDSAVEELFVMAADSGIESVRVLIAPNDLRTSRPVTNLARMPRWVENLYQVLSNELSDFQTTTGRLK